MALMLYVILPKSLIIGPRYLIPALELALLIPITIFNPCREVHETKALRYVAILLIALVNLANLASVALLIDHLVNSANVNAKSLVFAALAVWLTNVIVFGLWYWELDRGGPHKRNTHHERHPDFLFPQMTMRDISPQNWMPIFLDYLYLALTNATAFSPTDTMPLSPTAKSLMSIESIISMLTVIVVAARAVNILP